MKPWIMNGWVVGTLGEKLMLTVWQTDPDITKTVILLPHIVSPQNPRYHHPGILFCDWPTEIKDKESQSFESRDTFWPVREILDVQCSQYSIMGNPFTSLRHIPTFSFHCFSNIQWLNIRKVPTLYTYSMISTITFIYYLKNNIFNINIILHIRIYA